MKAHHLMSTISIIRKRTGIVLLLASGSALLMGVLSGGTAGARPSAIGPNQHFVGHVNGKTNTAVIAMACTFPLSAGERGHPLSGQSLTVSKPATTSTAVGFTGTKGHTVVARFLSPSAVASTAAISSVAFTTFGSQAIPTSFTLPCSGTGAVVFSPSPTSNTAQSVTVSVTYGNVTAGSAHWI
jgi:hypothetical protein